MANQLGIGISYRPEFKEFISDLRPHLDFVELVPDPNDLAAGGSEFAQWLQLLAGLPVVLHCTHLSVCSAASSPSNNDYVVLDRLLASMKYEMLSDHLSAIRFGELELGAFLPPAFDAHFLDVAVTGINHVRGILSATSLAVENVARGLDWKQSEWTEVEFVRRVLIESDTELILDVNNLFINAVNFRYDPYDYVSSLPAERVAYLHVAGYTLHNERLIDTHERAVSEQVWALAKFALERTAARGIVLERDNNTATAEELLDELVRARRTWDSSGRN